MVLNIYVKFHENIPDRFDVTERTRVCSRNFNVQMAITLKVSSPELRSLSSACRLIVVTFL